MDSSRNNHAHVNQCSERTHTWVHKPVFRWPLRNAATVAANLTRCAPAWTAWPSATAEAVVATVVAMAVVTVAARVEAKAFPLCSTAAHLFLAVVDRKQQRYLLNNIGRQRRPSLGSLWNT